MRAKRVLTRPRGWALLVAVVVAACVPLAGGTPGGAQPVLVPTVTVKKVVTGPVPPGTTFTVTVVCGVVATGAPTTPSSLTAQTAPPTSTTTITFDARGDPTPPGSNVVTPLDVPASCTVTEEPPNGGAQSFSYACASTGAAAACQSNPQKVLLSPAETSGENATVTVTNVFPPPPPVVVAPQFTG